MGVTTVRLKDEELAELKEFSNALGSDQSTLMKEALKKGLRQMRLELATQSYISHKTSLSSSAKLAKVTIWEFLDYLKKNNHFVQTDEENLEKSLKEFK